MLSWEIRSLKVPGGLCAFWIARGFSRFAVEQEIFLGLQTQLALWQLSPGLSSSAWGAPGTAGHWALVQHLCEQFGHWGWCWGTRSWELERCWVKETACVSTQKGLKPSKSHSSELCEIQHFIHLS